MMKYDVFISYSRKDYVDEQELVKEDSPVKNILEFLDKHQISYWFDKDGIYSGAEFVEVIANAIADSKMMLFVSSEHSNESIYTAGEIFEAIENQQLIIPVKIDESKYNKKFKLLLNPLDYIDITKADAFSDLLKAIEVEKARIAKLEQEEVLRREELKRREWRKAVKGEILEQVNELKNLQKTRKALLESIYKKLRSIDVLQKRCPICETKTDIETEHCQTCGWFFPALTEIEGLGIETDKSAKILVKSWWNSKSSSNYSDLENEIVHLKKEIQRLNKKEHLVTEDNSSDPTDLDLKKWNWEAFFFSWIWGFANGIKQQSLISLISWFVPFVFSFFIFPPFILLIVFAPFTCIYFGLYGTRLAWKAKSWGTWCEFQGKQKKWRIALLITIVILLSLIGFLLILYGFLLIL